jgi:hypothetical protein
MGWWDCCYQRLFSSFHIPEAPVRCEILPGFTLAPYFIHGPSYAISLSLSLSLSLYGYYYIACFKAGNLTEREEHGLFFVGDVIFHNI